MADHPAWQEILNEIPEALHAVVKPVLQKWDQGVQQTLESKTNELKKYEAFKQFVDNNIDPEWLAEAADFTHNFEQNPKMVIENANKAWNLGFNLDGSPVVQPNNGNENPTESLFEDDEMPADITQHPQFAELMQVVNGLKENVDSFTSQQQAEQQAREFNNFLDEQAKEHQFNRDYVTALMANGSTFSQALDSYNDLVANAVGGNQNENDENNNNQAGSDDDGAPVVMGNGGSDGSGLPDKPVSFGSMKSSDLEDTVAQMIHAAQTSGD